jgi:hypothetical protein
MLLTSHTGVVLAHQCAHTRRGQIPDQESPQKKYRNWCSHSHFGNCTSLPVRKTKLQGDDQMMLPSVIGPTREMTKLVATHESIHNPPIVEFRPFHGIR